MVMTREPFARSIARIACARRTAYHRPVNRGCNTMIAKKIQISVERSNDIGRTNNPEARIGYCSIEFAIFQKKSPTATPICSNLGESSRIVRPP